MTAFTPDVFDKVKGVVLDKIDRWLLLGLILFFAGHATLILGWRTSIKDYENALSWIIAAIVILAAVFVAGEIAQKPKRERHPKLPTLGDTKS